MDYIPLAFVMAPVLSVAMLREGNYWAALGLFAASPILVPVGMVCLPIVFIRHAIHALNAYPEEPIESCMLFDDAEDDEYDNDDVENAAGVGTGYDVPIQSGLEPFPPDEASNNVPEVSETTEIPQPKENPESSGTEISVADKTNRETTVPSPIVEYRIIPSDTESESPVPESVSEAVSEAETTAPGPIPELALASDVIPEPERVEVDAENPTPDPLTEPENDDSDEVEEPAQDPDITSGPVPEAVEPDREVPEPITEDVPESDGLPPVPGPVPGPELAIEEETEQTTDAKEEESHETATGYVQEEQKAVDSDEQEPPRSLMEQLLLSPGPVLPDDRVAELDSMNSDVGTNGQDSPTTLSSPPRAYFYVEDETGHAASAVEKQEPTEQEPPAVPGLPVLPDQPPQLPPRPPVETVRQIEPTETNREPSSGHKTCSPHRPGHRRVSELRAVFETYCHKHFGKT